MAEGVPNVGCLRNLPPRFSPLACRTRSRCSSDMREVLSVRRGACPRGRSATDPTRAVVQSYDDGGHDVVVQVQSRFLGRLLRLIGGARCPRSPRRPPGCSGPRPSPVGALSSRGPGRLRAGPELRCARRCVSTGRSFAGRHCFRWCVIRWVATVREYTFPTGPPGPWATTRSALALAPGSRGPPCPQ